MVGGQGDKGKKEKGAPITGGGDDYETLFASALPPEQRRLYESIDVSSLEALAALAEEEVRLQEVQEQRWSERLEELKKSGAVQDRTIRRAEKILRDIRKLKIQYIDLLRKIRADDLEESS